jgi:hypothetical protein
MKRRFALHCYKDSLMLELAFVATVIPNPYKRKHHLTILRFMWKVGCIMESIYNANP